MIGIARDDHRRLHIVARGVVCAPAHQDLCFGIAPRLLDGTPMRGKRGAVDYRAHEIAQVGGRTHGNGGDFVGQPRSQCGPEVGRSVEPRRGGALLALVLERAANNRGSQSLDVCRLVGDDEVLAPGLAHDSRIIAIRGDAGADRLPHPLKDRRRSREVNAGQVGMPKRYLPDLRPGTMDEVDHAVRQPGFLQQSHNDVGGVGGSGGRLPDDGVAEQSRAGREIAGNRGEVERCDGEDKPFQRPVLKLVPGPRWGEWLFGVDACHEGDVEPPEVAQLAGGIDLSLVDRLRLPKHGCRIQPVAPGASQKLGGAQKDRRPVRPGRGSPFRPRMCGRVDGQPDLLLTTLMHVGQDVLLFVGHDDGTELSRAHIGAPDNQGDLDSLSALAGEALLQAGSRVRTGGICSHRLVDRGRWVGGSRGTHGYPPIAVLVQRTQA